MTILKLEVGKIYLDEGGKQWEILKHRFGVVYGYLGWRVGGPETYWFSIAGVSSNPQINALIKEYTPPSVKEAWYNIYDYIPNATTIYLGGRTKTEAILASSVGPYTPIDTRKLRYTEGGKIEDITGEE